MSGSLSRILLVATIALAACSRWIEPLRYGSVKEGGDRTFYFTHGIQLFESSSGMRFAILPDDRTNLATIDLRYDVGAKDDPPGRAGLAHLVEHLMFELRAQPGAPPVSVELDALTLHNNAATSWDGTLYTSTAPAAAVDALIALEGRRMAATCDQLDDATVARERDVVLAEGAERADADALAGAVLRAIYGDGHPYARPLTSDEVAKVTRAEVCAFIAEHYVPARASLVITGDVDVERVATALSATFDRVARRPTRPVVHASPPTLRGQIAIRAPLDQPTAVVAFETPPFGTRGVAAARTARVLLADALAALDREQDWIVDTAVLDYGDARAPTTLAVVTVRRPEDLGAAADEVFARAQTLFEARGQDDQHLRARIALDYMQDWDDFGARGPWIATFLQYADHKRFMLDELVSLGRPWTEQRKELTAAFTPPRARVVLITPSPGAGPRTSGLVAAVAHDEHVWRRPIDPAEADRPAPLDRDAGTSVARYQLANGLTVELAPDSTAAIVDARLVYPVGRAHAATDAPLVPTAAAVLLDFDAEGFGDRATIEKMERVLAFDAITDTEVRTTSTTFSVRGLSNYADWHVWRLSALLDRGRYNQATLDAVRTFGRDVADDEAAEDPRDAAAARRFYELLYGTSHPLANPAPRIGASLAAINAEQLAAWKRAHYRPRGATLIVSGKFDEVAMRREIDELFGPWSDVAPAPLAAIPPVQPSPTASWLAVEDRDALQVEAVLAFPLAPADDAEPARAIVAAMLEDQLRDVREQLGASYGVHAARIGDEQHGGALLASGTLAPNLAGLGVQRMLASVDQLRVDPAVTRAAFVRARRALVADQQGRAAGVTAVADERERAAIARVAGSPEQLRASAFARTTLAEVTAVLRDDLDPARMVVRLTGPMPAVDAAFASLGREPERFPEPVPTRPPTSTPGAEPTRDPAPSDGPPPTTDAPVGEALTVDRWDEEGERHDGLFQGQTKLSLDEFLRIAGRQDLRDRMQQRWWLRVGLVSAGVVVLGAGVAYGITAKSCDDVVNLPGPIDEPEVCLSEKETRHFKAGLIAAAGVVLGVSAHYLSDRAPSKTELRQSASKYNYRRGLRGAAAALDLRVTPTTDGQTTGLVLSGTF